MTKEKIVLTPHQAALIATSVYQLRMDELGTSKSKRSLQTKTDESWDSHQRFTGVSGTFTTRRTALAFVRWAVVMRLLNMPSSLREARFRRGLMC